MKYTVIKLCLVIFVSALAFGILVQCDKKPKNFPAVKQSGEVQSDSKKVMTRNKGQKRALPQAKGEQSMDTSADMEQVTPTPAATPGKSAVKPRQKGPKQKKLTNQ